MEQLLVLNKHKALCNLLSGDNNSKAGISEIEVKHLAWLAANIVQDGDIVEIGSHRGKSTCVMGTACLESGNENARLFAIDLWTLGVGVTYKHYYDPETYKIFTKVVAEFGLENIVHPRMMSSETAASKRSKPIHLLFIDGNHKYKGVLQDYQMWGKFVPRGGRIAFHDYGTRFVGVDKVINEKVIPSGLWDDFHIYGRIWSATRR